MRAYHLDLSTVGALAVRRHEVPTPGAGEVLVRVGATALNYRDLLLREGRDPVPARPVAVGQTVLVLGTGGVALAAVQLAVALGARVVGATSGEAKVELLRRLGATHVIDYQARRDWHTELLELTDGRGVEHVVETVGPATLERSIRSTAFDGHIAMIGVFDGPDVRFDPRVFQGRLLTIRRIAVGSRAGLEAL